MRSSVLQSLINKQKRAKFGDLVANDNWPDLYASVVSETTKLDDLIPTLQQRGKLLSFTIFLCSQPQNPSTIKTISQLLGHLSDSDLQSLIPLLRTMVLGSPQCQTLIIDMIVRSFFLTDSLVFCDAILAILKAARGLHGIVANAIIKFFPQTSFPSEQQLRFMRASLKVCEKSKKITEAALGRIFQHLVALDCELMLDPVDGSFIVDDDIAATFSPQLHLFVEFVHSDPDLFLLLLQLFDSYLIDLPRTAAVQFIYFHMLSSSHEHTETFIGFLLAKLFDVQASQRVRANAALYIASLVVRAEYVEDDFAAVVCDYVADFAIKYSEHIQSEVPDRFKMDVTAHNAFYYAVQCVVYIFCWRWRHWRVGAKFNPDKRWRLRELMGNALRAADSIDKDTSELFRSLNVVDIGPESFVIERISVWFPFDPCPLDEIAHLIDPFYVQWRDCDEDPEDVDQLLDQELARICQTRLITIDAFDKSSQGSIAGMYSEEEFSVYQNELLKLGEENAALKDELKELRAANKDIPKLKQELEQNEKERQEVQGKHMQDIEELKIELENERKKVKEEYGLKLQNIEDRMSEVDQQITEVTKQIKSREDEVRRMRQKLESERSDSKEKAEKIEKMKKKAKDYAPLITFLRNSRGIPMYFEDLNSRIEQLQTIKTSESEKLTGLDQTVADLRRANEDLTKKIQAKTGEIKEAKEKCETAAARIKDASGEIDKMKSSLSQAKERLEASRAAGKEQLKELEQKIKSAHEEIADLDAKIKEKEEKRDDLQKELDAMKGETNKELELCNANIQDLRKKLTSIKETGRDEMMPRVDRELKQQIQRVMKSSGLLNDKKQMVIQAMDLVQREIEAKELEIQRITLKTEPTEKIRALPEFQHKHLLLEELVLQNRELRNTFADMTEQIKKLRHQNARLRKQLDALSKK